MAKSGNATAQGDEIKGDLGRVRRRSKDIEHDLNTLAEAAAEWNMLAGGRNRRNSKDYTDESLLEAFHEIDTDKSGSIEEAELEAAIRAMDPNASAAKIRDMLDFADADGDGQCVPAPLLSLPSGAAGPPFPEPPPSPFPLSPARPCLACAQGYLRGVQEDHVLQPQYGGKGGGSSGGGRAGCGGGGPGGPGRRLRRRRRLEALFAQQPHLSAPFFLSVPDKCKL